MNAIINRKQFNNWWCVDDNKLSHMDLLVVSDIIANIESKYGIWMVTLGPQTWIPLIEHHFQWKWHQTLKDSITTDAVVHTTRHLFEFQDGDANLGQDEAAKSHSIVSLLLYISWKWCYDIQTAIAFLWNKVSKSCYDSPETLNCILQYLYGTCDNILTTRGYVIGHLRSSVVASSAVHSDMKKSHWWSHVLGCWSFINQMLQTKFKHKQFN